MRRLTSSQTCSPLTSHSIDWVEDVYSVEQVRATGFATSSEDPDLIPTIRGLLNNEPETNLVTKEKQQNV